MALVKEPLVERGCQIGIFL